jgi:hypothetical protein
MIDNSYYSQDIHGPYDAHKLLNITGKTRFNVFAPWRPIPAPLFRTFDPVVGVGHSPLAERVHYHAQALASRREPVLSSYR